MKLTKRWRTTAALAAGFLTASAAAYAQAPADAPPPPPPHHGRPGMFEGMGPGPDMDFIGFEGGPHGKAVTGAPFSASFSSQSTQTLPDGNVITHTASGSIARDSQGRTRRDVTLPAIRGLAASSNSSAPHVVVINDPVASTRTILHPDQKTAESFSARKGGNGKGMARQNGATPNAAWAQKHANEVVATSLGTQTIGGVTAQGTRYTRTIPAGEIGNEKPIQIVTEKWYSTDLQVVVMVKRTDPMRGDSTSQLTEIQHNEPAASLFQVPADFSVTARSNRGMGGMPAPAAPQE